MFPSRSILTRVLLILFTAGLSITTVYAFQNATNQYVAKSCNVRYTAGDINWTNPNLNTQYGGTFNRVAITPQKVADPNQRASAFVEVGWAKEARWIGPIPVVNEYINASYTDTSGTVQGLWTYRPQKSSHFFQLQYDPLITFKWYFGYDGVILGSAQSNFTKGCVSVAGGEVVSTVEDMGNTTFSNLVWGNIPDTTGIVAVKTWKSNVPRLYQGRYSCTVLSTTSHRCGP